MCVIIFLFFFFFFFQAEDGIRDFHVTGVQTCALPISVRPLRRLPTRPPRCSTARCWETALGVTPRRRASAVLVAGERSAASSRTRGAPSRASAASSRPPPSPAQAPPVQAPPVQAPPAHAPPSHTVAAPRAGYSMIVWVLVARLGDTSGQLKMLGMSTTPSGPSMILRGDGP